MLRVLGCCILFAFQVISVQSQSLIREQAGDDLYQNGLAAYEEGSYKTAVLLLKEYVTLGNENQIKPEANFYLAMANLKEGESAGGKALKDFAESNRNHPLSSEANLQLGNIEFAKEEYKQAALHYARVSTDLLSTSELLEMTFKRGYAQMQLGNNKQAVKDFTQVTYYQKDYYEEAVYYSGLIYSNEGDYEAALNVLEGADKSDWPLVQELIANIYFQTGQYDELIRYAAPKLSDKPTDLNKTLYRLMGEAYYLKKEYSGAAKYLQKHLELSSNKMDVDGYFKLGYSYYKTQKDQQAIDAFKLAALNEDGLGQASSYYLGQLYVKRGNYKYALSAFQTVKGIEGGDPKLVEESTFLVGKIGYTTGQYSDAIMALQNFNATYPNSPWSIESAEILTQAYLHTSDYDRALSYIEGLGKRSPIIMESYQRICLLKGQQLFNDSDFSNAISFFNKSLSFKVNPEITLQAYYLNGEAKSMVGDIAGAKQAYVNCRGLGSGSKWSILSTYGLGYLAYNEKKYAEATNYFKSFVQVIPSDHKFYADAKLRLADCYFVQKDYSQAIRNYQGLLNDTRVTKDYINYQLGLTYALNADYDKARQSFRSVINFSGKSEYKDNAIFQSAETYITEAKFSNAVGELDRLIGGFPESSLIPFAYNKRALCYLNLNQNEAALSDYRWILDHHISHQVANDALLGFQELNKRGLSTPGLDQYMSEYEQANPDDSSLEVLTFEGSKTKYYAQDYPGAIISFKSFLNKYATSSFQVDAQYFLADSYYRIEDWSNAAKEFSKLTSTNNSYRSRCLDKRGKSLLILGDLDEAAKNYQQLLSISSNRKEVFLAREGLMKMHFAKNNLDSVVYYADLILNADWLPPGVAEGVYLTKGKALFFQGEYSLSTDEFIKVLNGPIDATSAEAKYYVAKAYYQKKQYGPSLETLFDLNKNYGSYPEWIGRSFLLIADNYIATDELLQAKATLNSIIENAQDERIVQEAKKKLRQIEMSEDEVIEKDSVETVNPNAR
ncbi:tetratricopeptide repeat protein [Marinoscillum sp. MHG1-6]|uniref:tetratricopeptide repeat protein n=1 Tax=Marinoscillum sp. MHG1-6 TaxID=2959627 RepID=UPI0021576E35|nr:tetratricopeptide repeat protein [Marinoscillum sp. MHG1-6]